MLFLTLSLHISRKYVKLAYFPPRHQYILPRDETSQVQVGLPAKMRRVRTKPYDKDKAPHTAASLANPNMLGEPAADPSGFEAVTGRGRAGTMMPPSETGESQGEGSSTAPGRRQQKKKK